MRLVIEQQKAMLAAVATILVDGSVRFASSRTFNSLGSIRVKPFHSAGRRCVPADIMFRRDDYHA